MRLFRPFFALIFISVIGLCSPAHAQFEDIGGILEDILGGGPLPGQTPIYSENGIETITTLIRYDQTNGQSQYEGHTLIVSAYVPNDPDGGTTKPQILGQTRILITGLEQPLQISIAVPRTVTKNLTFSRITAEVIDENENQVLIVERDVIYRGIETPELNLISSSTLPASPPPRRFVGFETIKGKISLNDRKAQLNGGTLTVQLMENALAGGISITIAAEKTISLEGISLPIDFTLDRGVTESETPIPLAFNAWITDWAGRKTHVMRKPVPYNGPDIDYKLKLDVITQGLDTVVGQALDAAMMAQAIVAGDALFDARAGVPADARLKVTLSRAVGPIGQNSTLATQTILITGFEGRVPFSLSAASTSFDPLMPAPILNLQITDRNGSVYFESGDIRAREGSQSIQLYRRFN